MDREAIYRRTIRTLMTSNGFGFGGFLAVFAVIGLLTSEMTGSDRLAGVPVAASTLGSAIAAAPLALRSRRRGRRLGLGFGYIVAIAGGAVAFLAAQAGLFWLLVAAMVFFGVGNASNLQHRFAAADLADDDKRGRAIGSVVWVGTIGAVLGAPAALWVNRIGKGFGLGEWVSPMLLGIAGYVIALAVVTRYLRPDPLEVSGALEPDAPRQSPLRGLSQSLSVVWPNPHARLALVAMVASQVAMVAVMTMTPLHMKDHGHAELSTIVIGAHVVGMYALAPVIGRWADRFGRIRSLRWGAAILGTGTIAAVTAGYVPRPGVRRSLSARLGVELRAHRRFGAPHREPALRGPSGSPGAHGRAHGRHGDDCCAGLGLCEAGSRVSLAGERSHHHRLVGAHRRYAGREDPGPADGMRLRTL